MYAVHRLGAYPIPGDRSVKVKNQDARPPVSSADGATTEGETSSGDSWHAPEVEMMPKTTAVELVFPSSFMIISVLVREKYGVVARCEIRRSSRDAHTRKG